MAAASVQMIAEAQASGRQVVLAITGGGSGAIADLLRVPGASRLVLEAVVPYEARALAEFLGSAPAQACSGETARAMAVRARVRAATIAHRGALPLGLGATASLASDRPKQGDHRCHIAISSVGDLALTSIVLAKGRRDRPAEEDLVARAIVLCLLRRCGVTAPSPETLVDDGDSLSEELA